MFNNAITTSKTVSVALITLLSVIASPASAALLTPELLYYSFDEASGSSTQNRANPGVGSANATINGHQLGAVGLNGGGLTGVGGSSRVNFVDTGYTLNLTSSWTVSTWLNMDNASVQYTVNNDLSYLFGDGNTNSSFRVFSGGAARTGNVILRGNGITDVTITNGALQNGGNLLTWVHDDSLNTISGYLNGVLQNVVAQPSTISIIGTTSFKVAGYSTNNALATGAVLDEFRLYNRALSAAEVAGLSTFSAGPATVPVPAAAWLFGSGLAGLAALRRRKQTT